MKKAEKLFKDLLNENLGYVDLKPITQIQSSPKKDYEIKYAEYLAEEKKKEDEAVPVVSKKESKHVEEVDSHAFDYADLDNIDNLNAEEFSKGVYFEMNKVRETVSDANIGEAISKARKVVAKNLAKDPLFYIKNAMFGIEGLGFQETELEEVSGKFASSGYSDKLKKVVKESLMGGVTTSGNPNSLAAQSGNTIRQMMAEKEEEKKLPMDEMEDEGTAVSYSDTTMEAAKPDFADIDGDGDKEESMKQAAKDKKKKMKKESIDSKLAEIGKEAEKVKMEAQLDFLHDHIQEKVDRVSSIQEDENLSELIDKTKMKQMQREIKDLERKKMKMERIYEKSCGKAYKRVEMVDETEEMFESVDLKDLMKDGKINNDILVTTKPGASKEDQMKNSLRPKSIEDNSENAGPGAKLVRFADLAGGSDKDYKVENGKIVDVSLIEDK